MPHLQEVPQSEVKKPSGGWLEKLILVIIVSALVTLTIVFWKDLIQIFKDPARLRAWIKGFGAWAPLVFILLQFIQVVIFIIPGEVVQVAGGYLFGIVPGFVYSVIGILAGSVFNFLLARLLGKTFISSLLGKESLEKMKNFINNPKAIIGFFLLFLIPGIPKDVLCYAAGLSAMPLRLFITISFLGRLPALLGSVILGNAAGAQQWVLFGIVLGVAVLLFILGFIHKDKIHSWVEKMVKTQEKES